MSKKDAGEFYYQGLPSPNGTIVPDDVFDVLAPKLTEAELRVLLYVVRRTFGFKKERDAISISQMTSGIKTRDGKVLDAGTGMSKSAVWRGVQGLVKKGVLQVERALSEQGDYETNVYSLRFRGQAGPEGLGVSLSENRGVSLQKNHPSSPKEPPVSLQESRQQTVLQETEQQHVDVVIDQLAEFGISRRTAEQLASRYPEPYILQKLDFVQWLKEQRSSLVAKSPAGYLRRALEEDYQPPPAYKPPAQRQAEATAKHRQLELEQEQRREAEAEFLRTREQARKALAKEYPPQQIPGTALTTETAWRQVLGQLQEQMTAANYQTWLKDTSLVSCDEATTLIVAPSSFVVEWLATRFSHLVEKELQQVLGFKVTTKYLAVSDLEKDNGQQPRRASQPPSLAPP